MRPAARGLGEEGRGGEWRESGVVKEEREGEEELPLFIFRVHAQWPPLLPVTLFIAVHPPGVDGGGGFLGRVSHRQITELTGEQMPNFKCCYFL